MTRLREELQTNTKLAIETINYKAEKDAAKLVAIIADACRQEANKGSDFCFYDVTADYENFDLQLATTKLAVELLKKEGLDVDMTPSRPASLIQLRIYWR